MEWKVLPMTDQTTRTPEMRKRLRESVIGRWLGDEAPVATRCSDGVHRLLPRRINLLAKTIHSHPHFRQELETSLKHYSGGDFIDVGASHGAYCFYLAEKASAGSRFVACEPEPIAFKRLLSNLGALQGAHPKMTFMPICAGVGDGSPIEFEFPMGRNYHPRVVSRKNGTGPQSVTVDRLVSDYGLNPCFVKVDVEGAEVFVLRGMSDTLVRLRPVIMLEVHPFFQPNGVSPNDLVEHMKSSGYTPVSEVAEEVATRTLWVPNR